MSVAWGGMEPWAGVPGRRAGAVGQAERSNLFLPGRQVHFRGNQICTVRLHSHLTHLAGRGQEAFDVCI